MHFPILTTLVALPIVGALLLLFVRDDEHNEKTIRAVALVVSGLVFAETLLLWSRFDAASPEFQFIERHEWMPSFGISYFVGVDGISLLLIVLTGFLTPIALLGSWESVHKRLRAFSMFILLLESAMIGVFISLDLFLFYVFWDAMLIPMYFLIGIWGYERRIYAAVKFLLYTMAGSVLMLLAILGLAYLQSVATGQYSFDLLKLYELSIAPRVQVWFFLAFALAFAIKVPLFPFHTWLPDAHVEAPTAGSVILAGVMLKMGTYGLVRFAFPLFPAAAVFFAPVLATLAVVGIIYGALVAMVQPDMKKLVAYSSVSHLGFVVLGISAMNVAGRPGRRLPDAEPWDQHGRTLPHRRHAVGSPAYAPDRRVRRVEEGDAAPRRRLPDHHAGLDRPARAERVRRRVSDSARSLQVEPADGRVCGDRRDSVGDLHALDVSARELRADHEREERPARGSAAA